VKINGGESIKPTSPATLQDVTSGKQTAPQGPAAPEPAHADKVEITSVSAQLQQLEKVLSNQGVVDTARVDAVKQAISQGRFQIDSEVVADKLLTSVRDLLLTQKKS
jgi:negative regulator of flagellin synthesis FlgM